MDLFDRLAMLYLALPIFLFFIGWFRPIYGAVLSIFLILGVSPLLSLRSGRPRADISLGIFAIAAVTAICWTVFGGAGHFFYANRDWPIRDAVLHDLVVSSWPVAYTASHGMETILRCPVAFFLPAAALAKIFGLHHADFLLFIWTAIGVFLFLVLALARAATLKQAIVVTMIIVLFSGMDILGYVFMGLPVPSFPQHLEWWAHFFQYSSNTTQLFWVPNHALSAWIIIALLYKHRLNPAFLKMFPIVCAITPLWSPLITIGLAPFVVFLLWKTWRVGSLLASLDVKAFGASILVFGVLALYITMDSAHIPSHRTFAFVPAFILPWAIQYYITFVILEFGVFAILLYMLQRRWGLLVAVVTLLLLPLYTFGPGNDLVMRSSIPALMLICLSSAYAVSEMKISRLSLAEAGLLMSLAIGAITPIYEFSRAIVQAPWQPSLTRDLIQAAGGEPSHYVARLNSSPLLRTMKIPSVISDGKN